MMLVGLIIGFAIGFVFGWQSALDTIQPKIMKALELLEMAGCFNEQKVKELDVDKVIEEARKA